MPEGLVLLARRVSGDATVRQNGYHTESGRHTPLGAVLDSYHMRCSQCDSSSPERSIDNLMLKINEVHLHPAVPADIPTILDLIRELAEFERAPDSATATPDLMYDALFGPKAVAHAIMAEDDAGTLGFALYFFNFSTWTGRRGLYLEDFYVRPVARGRGVGRMLFARLAAIAQECGCARMDLSVLDWNENAIRFYDRQGGTPLDDWTHYRFGTDAMARIVSQGGNPDAA